MLSCNCPSLPLVDIIYCSDCPPRLTRGLIVNLNTETGSNPTTKIGNRHIAVEAGAVGVVMESLS